MNYYQGTKDHPYHISIGAVVLNDEGKVCCHYFGDASRRKKYSKYSDFYLLMRETMEMGETIEQTLHRGLMEEFAMTGEIITYIGSIKSTYEIQDVPIEKTTIYFLIKATSHKPELRNTEDAEGESEIQWQEPDFLISRMKEAAARYNNSTFDESEVLEKIKSII